MNSFFSAIDGIVIRFIGPISVFLTALLAFVAGYDFTKLRTLYPNWSGLWDLLESPLVFIGFLLLSAVALATSVFASFRQPIITELEGQVASLTQKSDAIGEKILIIFDGLLLNLSNKLRLPQDGTSRISMYIHIEEDRCFVPCGRFSHNPIIKQKGRTRFPDTQGAIGIAWQQGWHFEDALSSDSRARAKYNVEHYRLPLDAARALNMQTRTICARRLDDYDHRPIAVIVVESIQAAAFDEKTIQNALNEEAYALGKMMRELIEHIPTPQEAERKGL